MFSGSSASAVVAYDEAVSGDFSDSGLSPTLVSLVSGSNEILGATGRDAAGMFRDYFTFTVPAGLEWTSLTVLPGTASGAVGFVGLQSGNQMTLPPSPADATGLLGWHHYTANDIDTDILSAMAASGAGSSGFAVPLGAGDYAVWIQDSSPGAFSYGFNIELTPVPDAGPGFAGTAGLLALVLARRWMARE